jgi:hypothetical protein
LAKRFYLSAACQRHGESVRRTDTVRNLFLSQVVLALLLCPPTHAGDVREAGMTSRVLWSVTGYRVGPGAAWGEKEAREMLFKGLDVTETSITFNGRTCDGVKFERETVETARYLKEAHRTTPGALEMTDGTTQVIRTDCDLPGFSEYMRLRDRRLIVPMHGVLFILTPVINY